MTKPTADRYPVRAYAWHGHGNLGDDWIFEVAAANFKVQPARERRLVPKVGRHRLIPGPSDSGTPLLLWGGGWLAADRAGADTLQRWALHLRKEAGSIHTFGLGIGPFDHADPAESAAAGEVLSRLGPISVRTRDDTGHLPLGIGYRLACDPVLLDARFRDPFHYGRALRRVDEPYVAISLPAWQKHWLGARPWLDETAYNQFVDAALNDAPRRRVYVEFDRTDSNGDARYWKRLGARHIRPDDICAAARVIAGADRALVGRLHAGLLASVLGVQSLAVGYHHKFAAVEELGIPTVGQGPLQLSDIRWGSASEAGLAAVRDRGSNVLADLVADLQQAGRQ